MAVLLHLLMNEKSCPPFEITEAKIKNFNTFIEACKPNHDHPRDSRLLISIRKCEDNEKWMSWNDIRCEMNRIISSHDEKIVA